jgi:hypothetical protein
MTTSVPVSQAAHRTKILEEVVESISTGGYKVKAVHLMSQTVKSVTVQLMSNGCIGVIPIKTGVK